LTFDLEEEGTWRDTIWIFLVDVFGQKLDTVLANLEIRYCFLANLKIR
jgi:hypothetical protein